MFEKVCGSKGSAVIFSHLEVNRCLIKDESEDRTRDKICKQGIHPGFQTQGTYHYNPKQGYHWPNKKFKKFLLEDENQRKQWLQKVLFLRKEQIVK